MSQSFQNDSAILRQELRRVFFRTLGLRFVSGLVTFVAIAAWAFLLVVLWSVITDRPSLTQAVIVSRTALIALGVLFIACVLYPIIRMPGLRKLSLEVERRRDFKDIVASGFEFSERDDMPQSYAPELVREVIRDAANKVRGLPVRFLFLDRRQVAFVPVAYGGLLALVIIALASPATLINAAKRITSPTSVAAVEHDANLFISPGDITVLAGSDVQVTATDFGETEAPVVVSYNFSADFWKTEATDMHESIVDNGTVLPQHQHTFKDIRHGVSYYFQSGEEKSAEYRINVVHKPIISELTLVLTPPSYTGAEPQTLVDSGGNVQALEGTHVAVTATANNTLDAAWLQLNDRAPKSLDVSDRHLTFDFSALKDGSYSVLLEDDLGHKTDDPLSYAIEVYADNPPVLDVLEPGGDASLPRNQELKLAFITSDDYGVNKAGVFFRKAGDEKFQKQSVPLGDEKGQREVAAGYVWDLTTISLFPGDYIEYFVQVEDNNVVTGPGITKSQVYHITVPTMAELYDKVKEEDTDRTDLLEQARKESEELKERIEKLSREFKKSKELDWTQKKEIDKALSAEQDIQDKLEDIQASLEKTLESLSDNKMTSQEIGEKMEEINKLIDEIDNEALNEYVEDLREAMEKLDPKEIQEALKNIEMSAEDMLKSLERTAALLEEIQREQQTEELVRKTKDVMDSQEKLSEETSDTNEGDSEAMEELAKEQAELAEQAEQLQKEMAAFNEEMQKKASEDPSLEELSKKMQEMSEESSKKDASESMKKASKKLEEEQKPGAMEDQQQAMNDMIALFSRMIDFQMDMKMQSQQRTQENLQRLAQSTLDISFKQEHLTDRLHENVASRSRDKVRPLAEQQLSYMNATRQIANELDEVAKRSVAIPEPLVRKLGETINNMQNAVGFLEQNKAFMSTTSASQAVTGLNEITIELLTACQNCSKGSGSGSPQPSSAMQQLMKGQEQVMQQTQQMMAMRAGQEKLLQERQAQMQRMLGQQRSLQEQAERIKEGAEKGDERVLGRMDKILEEMQEVIRDMDSGSVDEQTIRNEQKILSRLLDAQRSVHSRDYEKKRMSVAAEDVFSSVPDAASKKRVSQQLREEIRRALALKAPGEYEELIKLYFRALAEEAPLHSGDE